MKIITIVALSLVSSALFASNGYDLKIKVQHGDHIMTPRMMVKEHEKATLIHEINGQEEFVEVEASDRVMDGKKMILVQIKSGEIFEGGERIIKTRQEMLIDESEPSTLNTTEDNEKITTTISADRIEI